MTKQITIYSSAKSEDPPENLNRHIAWLRSLQKSIPEHFMESAKIKIEPGEYWFDYKISYSRPMTDDEINEERRKQDQYDEHRRKSEIALLAELRAKYPDK